MDSDPFAAELETHRRYLPRVAQPPMREIMELETDEIRKELTITANHLWVILHRARMVLRECRKQHWFSGQARA
jgi:hypothetical protein